MKKIIIIVISLSACHKGFYPPFDYNKSANPWIDAFKDKVFFSALAEAYKSDTTIFQLIEKKDALNPYDGLSLYETQKAEELGKIFIKNIPPPSMCETCINGRNYFMASSLHYYKSKELDSIARKFYIIHITNDKK